MKLTVIPSDRFMSKDGEKLFFDFDANPNIHAVQWYGDHGHVEYINPRHNEDIEESFIVPFSWENCRKSSASRADSHQRFDPGQAKRLCHLTAPGKFPLLQVDLECSEMLQALPA